MVEELFTHGCSFFLTQNPVADILRYDRQEGKSIYIRLAVDRLNSHGTSRPLKNPCDL